MSPGLVTLSPFLQLGEVARTFGYPVAPLVIGLVSGPMTENSLRKALMTFQGHVSYVLDKPIALTFLSIGMAIILFKIAMYFFSWGSPTSKISGKEE